MGEISRCINYVGVTCVDGNCPVALYADFPEYFDSALNCKECAFYKGCTDCRFASDDGDCRIDEIFWGGKSGLVLPPTYVAVANGIKTLYLQGFERATVFEKLLSQSQKEKSQKRR